MAFSDAEIFEAFAECTAHHTKYVRPKAGLGHAETSANHRRATHRLYVANHRERRRETNRAWHARHRKASRATARKWKSGNADWVARYGLAWKATQRKERLDACLCVACGKPASRRKDGLAHGLCTKHRKQDAKRKRKGSK